MGEQLRFPLEGRSLSAGLRCLPRTLGDSAQTNWPRPGVGKPKNRAPPSCPGARIGRPPYPPSALGPASLTAKPGSRQGTSCRPRAASHKDRKSSSRPSARALSGASVSPAPCSKAANESRGVCSSHRLYSGFSGLAEQEIPRRVSAPKALKALLLAGTAFSRSPR